MQPEPLQLTRLNGSHDLLERVSDRIFILRERDSGRHLRLKIAQHSDTTATAQLEAESRFTSDLDHPCFPRAVERIEAPGVTALLSEWSPGDSLHAIMKDPLRPERAADLFVQATDALEYLHQSAGLIHGSVNRTHVIVGPSDALNLIGLGTKTRSIRPSTDQGPQLEDFKDLAIALSLSTVAASGSKSNRQPGNQAEVAARHHHETGNSPVWAYISALLSGTPIPRRLREYMQEVANKPVGISKTTDSACKTCSQSLREFQVFCTHCGSSRAPTEIAPLSAKTQVHPPVKMNMPFKQTLDVETALRRRVTISSRLLRLSTEYASTNIRSIEGLGCLSNLKVTPFPHQERAVQRALNLKRGRVLLADDVGLGKTLEAIMIMEELRLRGFVKNVLVLAPATLCLQWEDELSDRLRTKWSTRSISDPSESSLRRGLSWIQQRSKEPRCLVLPFEQMKRTPYREILLGGSYDLAIADEIHHILTQSRTRQRPNPLRGHELLRGLKSKFLIGLSATPIQHSILDLYELADVIKPGLLGTWEQFRSDFLQRRRAADGRITYTVKRAKQVRTLLQEVMERTSRDRVIQETRFPRRNPHIIDLQLAEDEQHLYDAVSQQIRSACPDGRPMPIALEKLAEASLSSVEALQSALPKAAVPDTDGLLKLSRKVTNRTKLDALKQFIQSPELGKSKFLVFAAFPETRELIQRELSSYRKISAFPKRMSADDKIRLIRQFATSGDVLVVDDSAAVGLNLQMCDAVINFDFPWNPLLIEQRIGRIQRLGQTSEVVHIASFKIRATIDAIKIRICAEKLRLFEEVFGDLPAVLGALDQDGFETDSGTSITAFLKEAYLKSRATEGEEFAALRKLEERIQRTRTSLGNSQNETREILDRTLEW